MKKDKNKSLLMAKKQKKDEFYTQLTDIEKELKHYKQHFEGKVVYCNCDNPEWSNFWKYFELNFEQLKLKKLVATHYNWGKPSYKLELILNKDGILEKIKTDLIEDGDFRSEECAEILKEVDIIVTNPPFSLFKEYIRQLVEHNKKFIIIGNQNAISYKEVFTLIKKDQLWLGANGNTTLEFKVSDTYELTGTNCRVNEMGEKYVCVSGIQWFTNLDYKKRHENLILYKKYSIEEYPKYDNYNAINIDKTKEIPVDYSGVMGVPISFLTKHNPEQFEILGIAAGSKDTVGIPFLGDKIAHPLVKGKKKYARILIRKKVTKCKN